MQLAIEWARVNVLGFAPRERAPPPAPGQSYAQNLMTRFNMPSARGSDNLYGLVNQALSGASALYTGNRDAQAAELSRSANIIPDNIRNNDDRLNYVSSQRERLMTLLQAFDREADNVRAQREGGSRYHEGSGGLSKSRSEAEFDRIEVDEASSVLGSERPPYPLTPPAFNRSTSSGWMPWNWQRGVPPPPREDDPLAYGREPSSRRDHGHSTGYDAGDR